MDTTGKFKIEFHWGRDSALSLPVPIERLAQCHASRADDALLGAWRSRAAPDDADKIDASIIVYPNGRATATVRYGYFGVDVLHPRLDSEKLKALYLEYLPDQSVGVRKFPYINVARNKKVPSNLPSDYSVPTPCFVGVLHSTKDGAMSLYVAKEGDWLTPFKHEAALCSTLDKAQALFDYIQFMTSDHRKGFFEEVELREQKLTRTKNTPDADSGISPDR